MIDPAFKRPPHLIELQLLRHGDNHNQLMSPLTDYLALCGDYPATTINVPLKHQTLLMRLRALDYRDSEETRLDQLDDLTEVVSKVLAAFPGFSTELSKCEDCIAHVSLATSAAEMAMVPFELAAMPAGTAGAGQRLGLQPHIPVCLTRRSRNVNRPPVNWARPFRILMIASDAGGEVPVTQHYATLRKLIAPWLDTIVPGDGADRRKLVEKSLVLLNNPTAHDIGELLKRESFSHIHVLAHGAPQDAREPLFGVALHSSESPECIDIVDGERLGGLMGYRPEAAAKSPLVVSLAICQSGREGGVIVPGSSLAFELHSKGVPIVVGSQFPLSFGGALTMTTELYEGLLAGKDPRYVIWKTRAALFDHAENTVCQTTHGPKFNAPMHDWASMTVYAEFPDNVNQIVPVAERERYVGRLTPKMDFLDRVARALHESDILPEGNRTSTGTGTEPEQEAEWKRLLNWSVLQAPLVEIERFRDWIESHRWEDQAEQRRAHSKGILASAQKRLALVFLQIAAHGQQSTSEDNAGGMLFRELQSRVLEGVKIESRQDLETVLEQIGMNLLRDAQLSYEEVFRLARLETWAAVQSLCLSVAMTNRITRRGWGTAWQLSHVDRAHDNPRRRTWALAAIAELLLIGWVNRDIRRAEGRKTFIWDRRDMQAEFEDAVDDLIQMATHEPNEVRSALLQLRRFDTDFILLAATYNDSDGGRRTARKESSSDDQTNENEVQWWLYPTDYNSSKRRKAKEQQKDQARSDVYATANTLREFVRTTIDPLFAKLDLESYR